MLNEAQAREVIGSTLYDQDGSKVGKVCLLESLGFAVFL